MANFQLQDNQKVPYAIAEFDAKGNIDAPGTGDTAALTTDSPSSLSIAPDAAVDPAKVPNNADGTPGNPANFIQTGFIVGGSVEKVGCQVNLQISHADGSAAAPPSQLLVDLIGGPVATGNILLGAPVTQ